MDMYKLKSLKILLLIIILSVSQKAVSQINRSEFVGAYIYNFANQTIWPNENDFEDFKIILISNKQEIIDELQRMKELQKIKEKSIQLTVLSKPENLSNAQLIIICDDKLNYYVDIFDQIDGENILLVSENYTNKRLVMLNLYDTEDDKLLFEMNKSNISNQNLKVDDEILIMGGTIIDAAELYFQSQESLREMEKRMLQYQDQLDTLNQQIEQSDFTIEIHFNTIKAQNELIENHQIQYSELLENINYLNTQIKEQKHMLEKDQSALNLMSDSLNNIYSLLTNQLDKIKKGERTLKTQEKKISQMNTQISYKNEILDEQDITILKQQRVVSLFAIIIILVVVLVMLLIKAFIDKKNKNEILRNQKKEIEENNKKLSDTIGILKNTQQQLVQSEKMASLGVLTAGIAHEINNPVNFVYTGVNSLQKDFEDIKVIIDKINQLKSSDNDLNEKIKAIENLKQEHYFNEALEALPQTIKDIRVGADRTAEIVKGLRSFSRIDNNDQSEINIHESINAALLLLKNKYKNNIEIVTEFTKDLNQIEGNSGKLNQLFLNIINNAIDSIDEKGTIHITTSTRENNAIISIKDTGHGMDKKTMKKIFDPFFTTKEVGKGTGLGLSISYGIIKEHNGKVDIKSELNTGTEFIIQLPIRQNWV